MELGAQAAHYSVLIVTLLSFLCSFLALSFSVYVFIKLKVNENSTHSFPVGDSLSKLAEVLGESADSGFGPIPGDETQNDVPKLANRVPADQLV